ncbi:class I SAM-dependent RNA methyltransferase [Oribacterium sp. WCC10]|uniref:class I SAM-dependent RNA methyltransferase n=1 Tax=Oribacterium sp. WCC10 TaxID=1855343 RepID=UPI0008DEF1AB|nr:methyltransferase domain-containing protein [Oribacterium sp. WCC10]SFG20811.1 tRNA/tmRNA/rRNA uracil-C5-methylase, TrmA/RlmC/RlmD family [Oribacterium sp. WCC10]
MELCINAERCGGCFYQGISYEEELKIKDKEMHELLEPVVKADDYVFESIVPSPICKGYRNKMEFSFGDSEKDGPLTLGLHQKHSFFNIIDTDVCALPHSDANEIVRATRDYFAKLEITYEHKKAHEGYLRHLLFRRAIKTGEILVDLVTTSQWNSAMRVPAPQEVIDQRAKELDEWFNRRYSPKAQKKHKKPAPDKYVRVAPPMSEEEVLNGWKNSLLKLKDDGKIEGKFAGILHTINDSLADAVTDMGTSVLYGQNYFYEEILGLRFRITPFSFFQTNSLGAEKLYDKVREYAGFTELKKAQEVNGADKPVIYDLYSGTGTITQLMSSVASKAVGVEIVEEAVAAARENAQLNGVTNCDFIAGDVLKVIEQGGRLIKEDGSYEDAPRPDFIILDPPRDGIHPKALTKIIDYGVDKLIYVACKPKSLARDLVPLQEAGYKVVKLCPVDMFPRTNNCEMICLLSKDN